MPNSQSWLNRAFEARQISTFVFGALQNASKKGVRVGIWLGTQQAEASLRMPDPSTLMGKHESRHSGYVIGCGIRRDEAARLTVEKLLAKDGAKKWPLRPAPPTQ